MSFEATRDNSIDHRVLRRYTPGLMRCKARLAHTTASCMDFRRSRMSNRGVVSSSFFMSSEAIKKNATVIILE